jgi:hypothetical protein
MAEQLLRKFNVRQATPEKTAKNPRPANFPAPGDAISQ